MLQGWFLNQLCVLSSYCFSHMGSLVALHTQTYFKENFLKKKAFFGNYVHNSFDVKSFIFDVVVVNSKYTQRNIYSVQE